MNIKSRIKRLEADICPSDKKYGVLIYGYRRNYSTGRSSYMRDNKFVGYIPSVLEWVNGKLLRMISSGSEEGQKILKKLRYQRIA